MNPESVQTLRSTPQSVDPFPVYKPRQALKPIKSGRAAKAEHQAKEKKSSRAVAARIAGFRAELASKVETSILPQDRPGLSNPQNCVEYAQENHKKLLRQERELSKCFDGKISEQYAKSRPKFVKFLVHLNWLCEVEDENSMFRAVQTIDRLAFTGLPKTKSLIYILACQLIAEKAEEIYYTSIHQLFKVSGQDHPRHSQQYQDLKAQLLATERAVFKALSFNCYSHPTHLEFLKRCSLICGLSEREFNMANYFVQTLLHD